MAKRDSSDRESDNGIKIPIDNMEDSNYNEVVRLRLLIGVKSFSITGPASGKQYKWSGAGSVIDVDKEDVAALLSKRLGGKTCCGDSNSNRIFELVDNN